MEIKTAEDSGITIVSPIGRIDTSTAKNFEEGLMKILGPNKSFAISFSDIDYISSAGLRVILMAGKKISSLKGKFALTNMPEKIHSVFKMSGFDKILKICANMQEVKTIFAEES